MRISRRSFMTKSIIGSVLGVFANSIHANDATPPETEGPFYPVTPQKDTNFDLTKVKGKQGVAKGQIVQIRGKVLNTKGEPVENAIVDIWQANAAGKYRHPFDSNPAALDENFQGWAIVQSGKDGGFDFKTVIPGEYPASRSWIRPPHIHFKTAKRGYVELVTQMYFPNQQLNKTDLLLQRKSQHDQELMIAKKISTKSEIYEFNIVLVEA